MGTGTDEERARFCDSCNGVTGWFATFCDTCGVRLGEGRSAPDVPKGQRELASDEQELFQSHLRLIHRTREGVERIRKECRRITRVLKGVESRPVSPENRRSTLALSERLIDLESEWEDVQHAYNRESEGLEEDFLERADGLATEVDLSPEHQEAVEEELRVLKTALDAGSEEITETARFLDVIRARQESGLLGLRGRARATLWVGLLALVLGVGGAAYGVFVAKLPVRELALSLAPGWLGICFLFLHARARGA